MAVTRPLGPDSHLVLIDASGFVFRAYHALPPLTRQSDGMPVGAVAGYCNMLMKLLRTFGEGDAPATHLACVFDHSGRCFRNDIYPEYKAHRPPTPEDLVPQFARVREATRAFGMPAIELENYEADDLIATYTAVSSAKRARVTIVSADKDLMQMVGDRVTMFDGMRDRRIGPGEVVERFGVGPDRVIDVQSLAGDATDNVPGVPGIGVKTAATLIGEFGSLDALLEGAGRIPQKGRREKLLAHADDARLSRRLVTLKTDTQLPLAPEETGLEPPDPGPLLDFLAQMEFRTLTRRARDRFGGDADGAATASGTAAPVDRSAYITILDVETLSAWAAEARAQGFVAIDTETDGLRPVDSALVGLSLALAPNRAAYLPLAHRAGELAMGEESTQLPTPEALEILKPLLEDEGVLKIGQNIKFDIGVLSGHGIRMAPVDDTMLLSFVTAAGRHGHGLDELSERLLGHTSLTFKDVAGSGRKQVTFDKVPIPEATRYAAEDADLTLRLWQALKPELVVARASSVYETIERPLIAVVAEMERAGVLVDTGALSRLSASFAERMAALEEEAHRQAGRAFNLASPRQLGEILYGEMKLPGGRKTPSGTWSTTASTLDELAAEGLELARTLLEWRGLAKLKSTYADALASAASPETGRIHTSFSLAGAQTGRLASSDPNLQNIPTRTAEGRRIREAFVAAPGHVLISADYSQIELRLLAHVAGIEPLREAFRRGADIHAMTASEMFGVDIEGMPSEIRRRAKAINFGIIYGISAFGLARQLAIPRGEADRYIRAYKERFPGIEEYMEEARVAARETGRVETIFGRRCHLPAIRTGKGAERAFAERQAVNAPIQGSAADIIKRAMIRMPAALAHAGLSARMLLQVHDELLFEAPEQEAEQTGELAREVMIGAALPARELSIPLAVDVGVGHDWAEAH